VSIVHIAFYPSDWMAGTRALSDAETGVYITLIAHMYEMAGPIKRDDHRLYRMCGSKTRTSFVKSLEYLIEMGKIQEANGYLFNERVQKEIQKVLEKSAQSKAAIQSRWDRKSNKINDRPDTDVSAPYIREAYQSEPEPDKKERTKVLLSSASPIDDTAAAVSAYNSAASEAGWTKCQKLTPKRRSALRARLKETDGLDGWRDFLNRAKAGPHLCGQNDRGWTASFDWLTKAENFTKVIEGNYDPKTGKSSSREAADRAAASWLL
jgi:uncharacterized protein YdaU (DUF1376 family)